MTDGEAFSKALGFQPLSSTKSYDAYISQKIADDARSKKIDDFTIMSLGALDGSDPAGHSKMLKELRAWNDKMTAEDKKHMMIKIGDVQRRVQARRRENKPTPKQKLKGAAYADMWGL